VIQIQWIDEIVNQGLKITNFKRRSDLL